MSETTPSPDSPDPPDAELLELYLDGQLPDEQAREAEAMLARDPDMRRAVEQQARIDDALKRRLPAPAVDESVWLALASKELPKTGANTNGDPPFVQPKEAPPAADAARQRRTMLLAVAASLACVALWGSRWDQIAAFWRSPEGYEQLTVAQVYRDAVDSGFKPKWFCEDEQEFAETFEQRQGQGLLLDPLPEGIRMAGLAYLNGCTPKATSMMAYVDGQPVLILATRSELVTESQLNVGEQSDVAVFTRHLGGLTLVEVTPHDAPRVLPYLFEADVPASPTGRVPGARPEQPAP